MTMLIVVQKPTCDSQKTTTSMYVSLFGADVVMKASLRYTSGHGITSNECLCTSKAVAAILLS